MNTKVLKFGGTSIKNAECMKKARARVQGQERPGVIVVSAMGNATDILFNLGEKAQKRENWKKNFKELREKHETVIKDLGINLDLSHLYKKLKETLKKISENKNISKKHADRLASFGERMSSLIFSSYLNKNEIPSKRINTKEIIKTNNSYTNAKVNFKKTNKLIKEKIKPTLKDSWVVATGYIGESEEGHYSTLGRGGSDFTASIIAAALGAKELIIYTDVDGIYSCDPSLIKNAEVIPRLSYDEAGELAYFGAKVLHPKTILPAVEKNIPVRVKNSFKSKNSGTLITNDTEPGVKAIAWKENNVIINIKSVRMLEAHGFLSKIFNIFSKYEAVVDVLATSEVSVSLTLDKKPPKELIEKISKFAHVSVNPDFAVVCLVGDNLINENKVLGRLFSTIDDHKISMISQGASERNITFLVNNKEVETVVKKVFNKFFQK